MPQNSHGLLQNCSSEGGISEFNLTETKKLTFKAFSDIAKDSRLKYYEPGCVIKSEN